MFKDDYIEYIRIVERILTETKNQHLCVKLYKCLVITSSIQNILKSCHREHEADFAKCTNLLRLNGIHVSNVLYLMFQNRNYIAHVNEMSRVVEIFDKVDMQDIDAEFETIITTARTFSADIIKRVNNENTESHIEDVPNNDVKLLVDFAKGFVPPSMIDENKSDYDNVINYLKTIS